MILRLVLLRLTTLANHGNCDAAEDGDDNRGEEEENDEDGEPLGLA